MWAKQYACRWRGATGGLVNLAGYVFRAIIETSQDVSHTTYSNSVHVFVQLRMNSDGDLGGPEERGSNVRRDVDGFMPETWLTVPSSSLTI